MFHPFGIVGDHDHAIRGRRHDLFAQQRAAAALDEVEIGIDFVGAIDRQIEPVDLIQRRQRNAAALGIGARRLRCRHADDLKPGAYPLAKQLDKMLGGRPGAEAELHAVMIHARARGPPPVASIRPWSRATKLPTNAGSPVSARRISSVVSEARNRLIRAFSAGSAGITANGRRHLRDRPGAASDPPWTLPPTVVFDLDGTLVDTAPDLINALNFVLEPRRPASGAAGIRPQHDRRRRSQAAAARIGGRRTPRRAPGFDRLTNDFIDHYAAHIADKSRPFEGLEGALDDLAARGCRLAVCTNKLEWLSKRLLDELGLSSRFSAICGADTFGVAKPDPVILRQTVVRAGGRLASTVMVGDAGTGYRRRPARRCAGGWRGLRLY